MCENILIFSSLLTSKTNKTFCANYNFLKRLENVDKDVSHWYCVVSHLSELVVLWMDLLNGHPKVYSTCTNYRVMDLLYNFFMHLHMHQPCKFASCRIKSFFTNKQSSNCNLLSIDAAIDSTIAFWIFCSKVLQKGWKGKPTRGGKIRAWDGPWPVHSHIITRTACFALHSIIPVNVLRVVCQGTLSLS